MNAFSRNLVLALVLCLSAVGCKRLFSPPVLATKPAAEGRRVALAIGVLPSLDRSLARIGDVAKAINLPFDVAAMRETWLAQSKVPPEAAKAVDLAAPVALVLLPPASPDQEPEITVALELLSAKLAKPGSAALGKPLATKDDAASFKLADGTVFWMWRKGNHVVLSTSLDALVTGANLALESLARSEDDLLVTIHPEAIAKSRGTDVKSALAAWSQQMANMAAAGGTNAAELPVMPQLVKLVAEKVAEVDEATLTVRIDSTAGGTFTAALKPRVGSSLAKQIAKPAPYAFDPAVLINRAPFMLGATSPTSWLLEVWRALSRALTRGQGLGAMTKMWETMLTGLTGASSFSAGIEGKSWQQVAIYQLTPGVSADAYLDQIMTLCKSPELARLLSSPDVKVKLDVTRNKNLIVGEVKYTAGKMPARQRQLMKSFLGDKYPLALTAESGRMSFAMGKDARTQLMKLARPDPAKSPPSAQVSAALEETRSADGFLYIDPMQILNMGLGDLPASPMLRRAAMASGMPMWLSYRGGQTLTLSWRIPMSTVHSAGSIVPLLLLLGGAAR